MLTKEISEQIEVTEDNHVQIRTATRVMEDGVELAKTYHRKVISPGEDYSKEDKKVQTICVNIHTPEVVAAHKAAKAAKTQPV